MKHHFKILALLATLSTALAAPSEINYQGVLTDQQGNPVNGVRSMQIKLYDAPTGGNMTYQQNIGNVKVADGIYSFHFGGNGTSIGGSSGIIDALSISDQPWLELSVDGIAQSPRQKILTVPFAQVSRAVVHDYFTTTKTISLPLKRFNVTANPAWGGSETGKILPIAVANGGSWVSYGGYVDIPNCVRRINSLTVRYSITQHNTNFGRFSVSLTGSNNESLVAFTAPAELASSKSVVLPVNLVMPLGEAYRFNFGISPGNDNSRPDLGGTAFGGATLEVVTLDVEVPVGF